MPLHAGVRLGPYEIHSAIGAGGMGAVYKGRDTRLDRTVAIKVLPDHVASDPDACQRFEREARAVAALNHPHICTLYDVGCERNINFLVMEYLEGEPLDRRLARGRLSLDQALQYAVEMADALAKAHQAGIVHRDLKPGNIMLIKTGAKLMDFGLAKTASVMASTGLSMLPTTPPSLTAHGTILGTLQYMAPEQLEGRDADSRTDIFACGAVLYEMLTGRRAFEGTSQAGLIAAILEHEPPTVSTLVPVVPPALDRVVRKCLAKYPDGRWQSASDLSDELQWIQQGAVPTASRADLQLRRSVWGTAAVAIVAASAAAGWVLKPTTDEPQRLARFEVVLPAETAFTNVGRHVVALSPDGSRMVFVANQRLYLRAMDQLEATPIRGTDVIPVGPFFSPDGESIGFWSNGRLQKISVAGGTPVTIAEAPSPFGASWSGTSIFWAAGPDGIYRVPDAGGTPERVITVDAGDQAHGPHLLPDGDSLLFTLRTTLGTTWDDGRIVAQSLRTGEQKVLLSPGRDARYLPTGHLLYARAGTLFSVAFDAERLTVTGGPVAWVEDVADAAGVGTGAVHFAVSGNGTLAYVPSAAGNTLGRALVWVNRQGDEEPIETPPHVWSHLRLSPDDTRVVLEAVDQEQDIWVWDFGRSSLTRLTFDAKQSRVPVWLSGGQRVTFMTQLTGGAAFDGIMARSADGTGSLETLIAGQNPKNPSSVSPDGTWLVFSEATPKGLDVAMVTLNDDRRVRVLLNSEFDEQNGEVSPDGRWIAYQSNESGTNEVYVRPFPEVDGGRWQISSAGGTRPVWSRRDDELFYYVESGRVMSVPFTTAPTFKPGNPTTLFERRYVAAGGDRNYDVSLDGQRFLMVKETPSGESPRIVVVEHWFGELQRQGPAE